MLVGGAGATGVCAYLAPGAGVGHVGAGAGFLGEVDEVVGGVGIGGAMAAYDVDGAGTEGDGAGLPVFELEVGAGLEGDDAAVEVEPTPDGGAEFVSSESAEGGEADDELVWAGESGDAEEGVDLVAGEECGDAALDIEEEGAGERGVADEAPAHGLGEHGADVAEDDVDGVGREAAGGGDGFEGVEVGAEDGPFTADFLGREFA